MGDLKVSQCSTLAVPNCCLQSPTVRLIKSHFKWPHHVNPKSHIKALFEKKNHLYSTEK